MRKFILGVIVGVLLSAGISYATFQQIPIKVQSSTLRKTLVVDEEASEHSKDILYQLKILNEYMSRMTGDVITKDDIE